MFESGLDNELVALDTGFENSTMAADKPLYGANSKVGRGRADVIVGEDGNFYNEDGERVYYWVVPAETDSTIYGGGETKGIGQDVGGYYTESEIKGAWNADEGMGYLKQQVDWDNYWGFIQERQGLIQTGDLPDPTTPEYMADYPAADVGPAPTPNVGSSFGGGRDEEIYYAQEAAAGQAASQSAMQNWVQLNSSLMNKYGIPGEYVNGDGDRFLFNGSTFSRVFKAEGPDWGKMIAGVMVSAVAWAVAGPTLVSAFQGAGMSAAVAKGAAAAVLSGASQGVTEGEIDLERALVAAVTAYGGSHLSDALAGSGVLGEVGDKITAVGDALMDNGGDVLQAALSAGGISAVTQLVMEGEIDWQNAGIAALGAGGMVALKEFLSGIGKPTDDAFLQELAEQEEWQQAAIDADIKDPFLNPNYKTVGDGLVMNINTNEVFGVTSGDSYGSMGDLDLDGDGALSGDDLQNIDVPERELVDNPYQPRNEYPLNKGGIGRRYYLDAEGNIYSGSNIGFDGDGYFSKIDGTRLVMEGTYDESSGLYLFKDSNGSIVQVADKSGAIVSVYDSENKVWTNPDGTPNDEYNKYLTERYNSGSATGQGINDPFNLNRDDYDAMTGEQLLDDYFKQYGYDNGENMQIALTDGQMQELVNRFGSGQALEDHLQAKGYGVHYTSEQGWRVEFVGPDATVDGIYGINHQGSYISGLEPTKTPGGYAYYDPDGNPTTVNETQTENPFNKPADNNAATGPANDSTDAGGASSSGTNVSTTGNAGTGGGDAPTAADAYSDSFIQALANATANDIGKVIERINNGESPSDIFNDPTGANVVTTADGTTTVTPATTAGGGTNTGSTTSGGSTDDENEDQPKDGDTCQMPDGRTGIMEGGKCVFQPTIISAAPSVWAGNDNTNGGTTDSNNSGSNSNNNAGGTNTTSTTVTTPGSTTASTTPGVITVGPSTWGTGNTGDGNTGSGDGTGDGEGSGDGAGGGGDGGSGPGGNRIVATASNTKWSPLFPGTKFRRFDKRARQGMMASVSQPNFSSDSRQNLYAGMFADLMKGKA